MLKHSNVGASSCERWWNCPGSVALIETLPPQPESEYANEGSDAHELAEKCLRSGKDALDFLGGLGSHGFTWDEEMCEHVQVYLNTIRMDMELYDCKKEDLVIEQRFHLKHIDEGAFGTADAVLRVFLKFAIVYDFKYGKGVAVNAEENKQEMYYGVGAALDGDFEEYVLVIVQPRAHHKEGPIRRFTVSKEQLDIFAVELGQKIEKTREKDAPLCAGPWCRKTFCAAMAVCPAVKKQVEKVAGEVFESVKQVELPNPETMPDAYLKRALDLADTLTEWIKAVKTYAFNRAVSGDSVLGYKLVRGKPGNRKWADEKEVESLFELEYGDKIYETPSLKSPAQLEKVVGKKAVETLTVRPEGKIQLVENSDSRPEIQADALSAFKGIEKTDEIE